MKKIFLLLSLISTSAFANHTATESIVCKVPKKPAAVKVKKAPLPVKQEIKRVEAGKDIQINVNQWMTDEGDDEDCLHHETLDSQTLIRLFKKSERDKTILAKRLKAMDAENADLRTNIKALKAESSELKSNLRMVNKNYYVLEQRRRDVKKADSDGQLFIGPVIGYGPVKIKDSFPDSDTFEEVRFQYGAVWGGRLSGTSGDFNLGLSGLSNRSIMFDISYNINK